jgi:hypothetical protein
MGLIECRLNPRWFVSSATDADPEVDITLRVMTAVTGSVTTAPNSVNRVKKLAIFSSVGSIRRCGSGTAYL